MKHTMICEKIVIDKPTVNNRIYSLKVLTVMVDKYQDIIKERKAAGILGSPEGMEIKIELIAFRVDKLYIKDDKMVFEITTSDTDNGRFIDTYIKKKRVEIGVMMMGRPIISEEDPNYTDITLLYPYISIKQ